jgi:predicted Zn-dependent protease
MMSITALPDFTRYLPLFTSTISSFRELNDRDKLNRKPDRINVKQVKETGTLAQVLSRFNIDKDNLQEMAILNGMQLEERVEQGTLIKVVEKEPSQ